MRDLAWACFSPCLISTTALAADGQATAGAVDCAPALTPARLRWLEELDRDATPLLAHLAERPARRLGLYFERLWHFFLSRDAGIDLLAHNLPVRDRQRTLGEFDILYYCRTSARYAHLELAVKYYLGLGAAGTGKCVAWVGPDSRDRLDRKLAHLFERQLRLGDAQDARERLAALGVHRVRRELAFHGCLFRPHDTAVDTPPGHNRDSPISVWAPLGNLRNLVADAGDCAYLPLPRLRWLSPARLHPADRVRDAAGLADALATQLQQRRQPVLVAALDGRGEERRRFFVAPDGWPGEISEKWPGSRPPGT